MYKQSIPEHARTIRNIHNGLTSGQNLFFGPTRSWDGPCGQAAFKGCLPTGGDGDWDKFTSRIESFLVKFYTESSRIVLKSSTSVQKTTLDRYSYINTRKTEDLLRETIRRQIVDLADQTKLVISEQNTFYSV